MSSTTKLGLARLLGGGIVILEGNGHPPVLESLIGEWKASTMEKKILEREGRHLQIFVPGGSVHHLSMLDFWAKGTFSEEKGQLLETADSATLLAISHLGFEVPQAYRKEAVRILLTARLDKIRAASGTSRPMPCAIIGVDGPPGTLRARYGDDLSRMVGEVGIKIETP